MYLPAGGCKAPGLGWGRRRPRVRVCWECRRGVWKGFKRCFQSHHQAAAIPGGIAVVTVGTIITIIITVVTTIIFGVGITIPIAWWKDLASDHVCVCVFAFGVGKG